MADMVNIYITDMYTNNITEKNAKIEHMLLMKFENNGYFLITPRILLTLSQQQPISFLSLW